MVTRAAGQSILGFGLEHAFRKVHVCPVLSLMLRALFHAHHMPHGGALTFITYRCIYASFCSLCTVPNFQTPTYAICQMHQHHIVIRYAEECGLPVHGRRRHIWDGTSRGQIACLRSVVSLCRLTRHFAAGLDILRDTVYKIRLSSIH